MEYAKSIYPRPIYTIQKIADKFTADNFELKVFFLPVVHPELNPIEMIRGIIKRKVAERNLGFKLTQVEEETKLQISKMTPTIFQKFVLLAIKEQEKYRLLNLETKE